MISQNLQSTIKALLNKQKQLKLNSFVFNKKFKQTELQHSVYQGKSNKFYLHHLEICLKTFYKQNKNLYNNELIALLQHDKLKKTYLGQLFETLPLGSTVNAINPEHKYCLNFITLNKKKIYYASNINQIQKINKKIRKQNQEFQNFNSINPNLIAKYRFLYGWTNYISYDFVKVLEPKLNLQNKTQLQNLAIFELYHGVIHFDNLEKKLVIFIFFKDKEIVNNKRYKKINQILYLIYSAMLNFIVPKISHINSKLVYQDGYDFYNNKVNKIKKLLVAGDAFQINLTRQWLLKTNPMTESQADISALNLYFLTRKYNPAAMSCLFRLLLPKHNYNLNKLQVQDKYTKEQYKKEYYIICCSPERLLAKTNSLLETKPIAGTRKKSQILSKNQQYKFELKNDTKEMAEHIMLVDMLRNDLGKISSIGSVNIDKLMAIEEHNNLFHLVTTVRSNYAGEFDLLRIIKAIFPGGSVTGCPKFHAMEIINQLEVDNRNYFTGSFGYISQSLDFDFNILIRSLEFDQQKQLIRICAAAGIVIDSTAKMEYKETYNKVSSILKAFNLSQKPT